MTAQGPTSDAHPTAQSRESQTIRVHLAEAPTDVLVWLVDQADTAYWTLHHVAENAAPGRRPHEHYPDCC